MSESNGKHCIICGNHDVVKRISSYPTIGTVIRICSDRCHRIYIQTAIDGYILKLNDLNAEMRKLNAK